MEDSSDVVLSPKKIKKSRWGPVTASDSPRKSSTEESGKVIPNGTGNNSSENSPKEEVKEKPRIVKITKVVKSAKTELTKARSKSPPKEESEPVSTSTPCDSPTTSQLSEDGFLGFDSVGLQDKQDTIHRILVELKASSGNASSSHLLDEESEVGETDGENSRREEEMTVDSDTGRDSDQMEIDMGNDKDTLSDSGEFSDKHDKSGERTKDSDVEIMETDSVRSDLEQSPKKVQENNVTKTDDKDASSSILESTLKGKPPTVKTDGKPLLSVRKDLAKVLTPSPTKRRSLNKDGSTRSPKIDISNPAFLKPFDYGWKRELVYRSTNDSHNRRQGDIYYYTPQGKKLRSLREICDHLVGSDLTQDNFTFWKEPLGLEDPQKEIIRDAKLKLKDPLASPTVTKKVIPKITKVQKTTPKLTATVPPLDSSIAPPTSTTPKASASVTPRVVFKGKNSLSSGPKFKVTPSKNTVSGQTPKIIISKDKKRKPANDEDELVMGMLPPMWDPSPKPKENKSAGVKRPIESSEESPPAKRVKTDVVQQQIMENFMQNVNFMYIALLNSFQYLKVQELLRASRVCHLWQDIALHKSLWETVRMKNSLVKDWEGFANTLRSVGTRHLDLRKILVPDKQEAVRAMWNDCVKALSKVNTLVKLDLCRCTAVLLEQIAAVCPQLESIAACTLKNVSLNLNTLGNCLNLTELRLKSQSGIELNNVTVLGNLTKLKHLSLTSIKNTISVMEVIGKMTHLESLELGDFMSITETAVTTSFSQLTRLRRLRLEKGQCDCPTDAVLQTISQLPSLVQLELINFDVKAGFEDSLALCSNIKRLLIIPTYVTQSATTNHLVIEGVSKLTATLQHFVWGLTLELLRVTDLFIDQWEMGQKSGPGAKSPSQTPQKKSTGDSIPILKPATKNADGKKTNEGAVTQVDVLQLPKLHKVLTTLLPSTKIIILKVPFSATWRQTISGSSQ